MMVSPEPYVVINNQKFTVGDRFLLPVEVADNDDQIINLIDSQMPDQDSISPEAYKKFKELRDEAVENYRLKQREKRKSKTNATTYNVSVTIKAIEHRRVIVTVNGEDYVLPITMAL